MSATPASFQEFDAEADGLLTVTIIRPRDMLEILAEAARGNADAAQLVRLTARTLGAAKEASHHKPAMCGCCARPLVRNRCAVVIARPARLDPTQGMSLVICTRCGPDRDTLQAKAAMAVARAWPDAQVISITHPRSGRA